MAKRTTVRTNNKEIYDKLNMLHFSKEVILQDVKPRQITEIINKINKNSKVLDMERLGEYFIIKKVNPLNVNIYLNTRKNSKL